MENLTKQFQDPIISVIVPVYNTSKYLEECFNSLIMQSLQDIEIIVIDDGSTDGSGIVCDQYAKKDSRFRIIHKQHEGLAVARSEGIKLARTNYIMFVDSDDWVSPVFCEEPLSIIKRTNADLVVFQYNRYVEGQEKKRKPFPNEGILSKKDILTILWPYTSTVVWNKLFKRELFNEIEFPAGHLCEDLAVTYQLIHAANKVYVSNICVYHHRSNRLGSITLTESVKYKKDRITYDFNKTANLKQWGYVEEIDLQAKSLLYLFLMGDREEWSSTCIDEIAKISLKQFVMGRISWKYKVLLLVYLLSPLLFHFVSRVVGKRITLE